MTARVAGAVPTEIVNTPELAPSAMESVEGSETRFEFDTSCTAAPPAGAAEERVTVPVSDPLPANDVCDKARL